MQVVVLNPDSELTPALRQCCWTREVSFSVVTTDLLDMSHFASADEHHPVPAAEAGAPLVVEKFVCQVLGSTPFPTLGMTSQPARNTNQISLQANLQFCDDNGIAFIAVLPGHSKDRQVADYAKLVLQWPRAVVVTCDWLFGDGINSVLGSLVMDVIRGNRLFLDNRVSLSPNQADYLAAALLAIAEQLACGADSWGAYHFENPDFCTEFGFAECIANYISQFADIDINVLQIVDDKAGERLPAENAGPGQPTLGEQRKNLLHNFGIKQVSWRMGLVDKVRQLVSEATLKKVH